jgi:hypothetical protein
VLISFLGCVIMTQIREYHEQSDPMLHVLRELLLPVHPIFKEVQLYKGNRSYTINKEKIYICLNDENGDYYPMNQLVYVILHEIAHKLNTKDVGHTPEWQRIFDELLDKAEEQGIWSREIPIMQNYCHT